MKYAEVSAIWSRPWLNCSTQCQHTRHLMMHTRQTLGPVVFAFYEINTFRTADELYHFRRWCSCGEACGLESFQNSPHQLLLGLFSRSPLAFSSPPLIRFTQKCLFVVRVSTACQFVFQDVLFCVIDFTPGNYAGEWCGTNFSFVNQTQTLVTVRS